MDLNRLNFISKHTVCALLAMSMWTASTCPTAHAYKLNSPRFTPDDFPLKVAWVGPAAPGLSIQDMERALDGALATWDEVECSALTWSRGQSVDTFAALPQRTIAVSFTTPGQLPCFPESLTLLGLATQVCDIDQPALVALNTRDYTWVTSVDDRQLLIPSPVVFEQPHIHLQSVLTHELGHVLGLAHPDSLPDPQSKRLATMFSAYQPDGGQATLAADDRFGLCALYPAAADKLVTCSDDASCNDALEVVGAQCLTQEDVSVCEQPQGVVGSYCAVNDLRCPGRCLVSSSAAGTGYCTQSCEQDSQCPTQFTCKQGALSEAEGVCVWSPSEGSTEEPSCATTRGRAGQTPVVLGLLALLGLIRRRRLSISSN